MKARSCRLALEVLEDRSVPATVDYGDFNHDGRLDMAAITAPTTVTVSLANPDGSYTVSATLTTPQNRPMQHVNVVALDADGILDDIVASSHTGNNTYFTHTWRGEGDGTFGPRHTEPWHPPKRFV